MDIASATMLIGLIAQGIGVVSEIQELARRVEAGEVIDDAEIAEARAAVVAARQEWDNAGDSATKEG